MWYNNHTNKLNGESIPLGLLVDSARYKTARYKTMTTLRHKKSFESVIFLRF